MRASTRSLGAAVAVLLLILSVAATADARRKPTARERAALAARTHIPARCLTIFVSTVNQRWATVAFDAHKIKNPKCAPFAADGVIIDHRKHGKWHQVTAGSDFECPFPGVPPKVVKDLRLVCHPR